ncbi:MAG TPA: DUF1345 domain-containing protein [Acetobacteraceae bacterium]
MGFAWRVIMGRPRLAVGLVCGLLSLPLWPVGSSLSRAILGWDAGCAVFLVLVAYMFSTARGDRVPEDAQRDQDGEWTIFWLTVGAVTASFAAIIGEFSASKDAPASQRTLHIILVAVTLLLSWLVTHTLFGMRNAHEYYDAVPPGTPRAKPSPSGGSFAGGLDFPGDEPPDYWDFFYFALVLGMTFQVSDVQITSRRLRQLATAHGMLGFLFNTVILALSVNIGASLL